MLNELKISTEYILTSHTCPKGKEKILQNITKILQTSIDNPIALTKKTHRVTVISCLQEYIEYLHRFYHEF